MHTFSSRRLVLNFCLALLLQSSLALLAFGQDQTADFDYANLVHPEIAEFLALTDQQRTQVANLVAEQTAKTTAAAEADRPAIVEDYAGKLRGLLTPEQLTRLAELPELRKLQFNFGSQNWEDVLRWFAKQADLSLVMSSAPSGSFNYTDSNQYTPSQAINLLNSILLTKGYTLVRRDKLLILVEVSGGIPDEILPRVTVNELDKRGSFEIVSVMFTLGNKPAATVMAEVKPLLGNYGKMALLPQSNQLLITETVGKMKAINMLIASIPAPAAPPPEKPAEKAPPPILESYPLGSLDFEATAATIKSIAPGAVTSGGAATRKLIVFAPPAQQELVKNLLDQLNSGTPVQDEAPRLQVYQLDKPVDPKQFAEQMALVAPQAKVAVDAAGNRVMVFAAENQQRQVAETLETLGALVIPDKSAQVRLFSLRRADPTVASQMAQAVSPRATVNVDATTKTLIVRALPAELEIIAQLVDQLDNAATQQGLTLKSYDFPRGTHTEFLGVLAGIAPKAKIQVDDRAGKLLVIAEERDQQALADLITQYQGSKQGATPSRLHGYEVTPELKTRFLALQATLPNEFGKLQVIPDELSNRLTIWADAGQHDLVAKMLEDLKAQTPDQSGLALKSYETSVEDLTGLQALLQPQFPGAKITANPTGDRLLVWASPEQQEKFAAQLAALTAELPRKEKPSYESYPLPQTEHARAIEVLQPLAPAAKITSDPMQQRLLVWAVAKDHEILKSSLARLFEAANQTAPNLVTMPLDGLDATSTTALIKSLVPRAQVTLDAVSQQLVVVATEADQAAIRKVLDQLQSGLKLKEEPTIKFYPLEPAQSAAAIELLTQLVPSAKPQYDRVGRQLSVIATNREHEKVSKALTDLQAGIRPQVAPTLAVYPLAGDLRPRFDAVVASLATELGDLKIVDDKRPGEVAILASPAQHELLKQILLQVAQPVEGAEAFVFKAYPLGATEPKQLVEFLTQLFPTAKVVADDAQARILVWAPEKIQAEITKVLSEFTPDQANGRAGSRTLRAYKIGAIPATTAIPLLQQLVPRMQLTGSDQQGLLLAWGRENDHELLKTAVEQFSLPDDPRRLTVKVYPTEQMDPQIAAVVLGRLLPDAIAVPNVNGKVVAVMARQDQQPLAADALEQMKQFNTSAGELQPVTYNVEKIGSTTAVGALTPVFPQSKFFLGGTTTQIVALASEVEHAKIKETITQLSSVTPTDGLALKVYRLRPELAAQVRPLITTALPTLKVLGTDPQTLPVLGREEEHKQVQELINQAEQQLVATPKTIKPYTVQKLTLAQARSSLLQKIPALSTVELGGDPRVLYLLATDEEHAAAGQLLTELEAAIVPVPETIVTLYSVDDVDLTQLTGLLPAEIASRATIKPDPINELLIVTAPADVHVQLAPAIAELSAKLPKLDKVTSRIYPLGGLRSRDWSTFLTTVAPGAVAAFDRTSGSLVVVGTRETHEKVSQLLSDVRQAQTEGKVARPYLVSKADVTVISTVLTTLFPEATFTPDTASRSLIAIATEEDQKSIELALAEIDLNSPAAPVAQVYPIPSGDATALAGALKGLVPAATFVPDATGRSLLALASAENQTLIKQTIEQWTQDPARMLSTRVYQLAQANPATGLPILQKLLPAVTFSADPATRSIAAAATAEQHQAIAEAVKALDAVDSSLTTKIYPLGNLTAKDWQALLAQLAPGAISAADPNSGSLIIAAPAATHAQLAQLMEEFKTAITAGKVARAYRLSKADVTVAAEALSALLPNSKVSVDKTSRSLIIVASEEDQQTASATIEQLDLNAPGAPVSEVYAVNTGDAAELAVALKGLVPSAAYVADKAGKSLLVLATPDEQSQIRKTVEQWTGDASRAMATKVYQLSKADPAAALPVLQKLLPSVTFSADPKTRAIAATATAEQHQSIATAVAELDKLSSPAITRIYPSGGLLAKDWQSLVAQLAPDAVTAVDPDSGSLIVAARPDVHEQLGKLVEEFRNATTAGKSVRAYRLSQADPQVAADAISALTPASRVTVDKTARSIVVVASETDQELISKTIAQLDREASGATVSRIYPVASGDSAALATALKSLVPTGTYVADSTGKSLLVIASPKDQEVLGKTVAEWGGDGSRTVSSKVYGFANADPTAALAALQKLIPGATLAADPTTRSLLATATAEQHELLAATITQLDSVQLTTGEVTLKTYVVNRAPADSIAKALGDLFKKDTQVSIAADKETNSLIAIARPRQHDMIEAMVSASEKEMSDASFGSQIQIYPLANTDGKALVESLEKLFQRQRPAPEITYDDKAQQLIVMGNAAQQALVQQLVVRLTGEQQEFEMFRLTTVDPFTAESAINGLFRNEPRSTAPSIQTDFDNSYLFIRASQPQMTRIREVLRKLGEPQTSNANLGPANNLMRVVPLGTDSERIIEQINKLWPQLQPNQLRIIDSPEKQLNKQQAPQQTPAPSPLPGSAPPKAPAPADKSTLNDDSPVPSALAGFASGTQEPGGAGNAANRNNVAGTTTVYSPQDPAAPDLANQERAPIFVIPGNRQLTIASSDPQAIQQMEELIRAIASPIADAQTSGNFETFPLKNAGASEVASILNGLFEDMGDNKRGFGPPVVITADDRLNLLIVHGSRSDRETIGKLAEVLDSPDVNEAFSINQPEIVTVKNTDADRILRILQNVYRTQLSSGGGRRQIPIPDGVSTEMATMLQQINAATSGPLLTLGVDGVTNSLIVLAPQQLRDQVKATIEQLDRNVEVEPGEKIEIIQLKETNPARIQRALDLLFKQGPK